MKSDVEYLGLDSVFDKIALPPEYRGDLYHYTSPFVLDAILFKKVDGVNDSIVLRSSRYDCLNDRSEGTIAERIYHETYLDMYEKGEITEEIYRICSAVKTREEEFFYYYDANSDAADAWYSKYDRFISSFSKNPDSLSMWKYYSKGNGYEGICLGFDSTNIRRDLIRLFQQKSSWARIYPVVYSEAEQKKLIKQTIKTIHEAYANDMKEEPEETSVTIAEHLSYYLDHWGLIFKSEYFQHEEEVRIIVTVSKERQGEQHSIPIEYRYSAGYWIPYVNLYLGKETLQGIVLGPTTLDDNSKEKQLQIVRDMLCSKDYDYCEVRFSNIPLRY